MAIDPKIQKELLGIFENELKEENQKLAVHLVQLEQVTKASERKPIIEDMFRISHNIKGAAKSVGIPSIADIANQLENTFDGWRQKRTVPQKHEINHCLSQSDELIREFYQFQQQTVGGVEPVHSNHLSEDGLTRVSSKSINHANAKVNQFVIYQSRFENLFKEMKYLTNQFQAKSIVNSEVDVFLQELDALSATGTEILGEFDRGLNALQDHMQSMQLTPMSYVLTPLIRTVRDISSEQNKTIQLKVQGDDVEVDKSILEHLKDPLLHIIRNAIDHGIEEDDERVKNNKSLPSQIQVNVVAKAGQIKIEIIDDGRGVDIDALTQKAIKNGVIKPEKLKTLSDQEAIQLMLISGLTSKDTISDISGRGVGLDVVKHQIDKVKGSLSIQSKRHIGTTFTLKVPMSLATTRGIYVFLNEQQYMIPTPSVKRVYSIGYQDLSFVDNQYVYIIDGQPIPVQHLDNLLGISEALLDENFQYIGIVIDDDVCPSIILVDGVADERETVVFPLPVPLNHLKQYVGVTLNASNSLVIVLDAHKLINHNMQNSHIRFVTNDGEPSEKKSTQSKHRILVVDDALTTRTLIVNALQATGFEVDAAVSGIDALKELNQRNYSCLISDIDMPEMDGYELVKSLNDCEKNHDIPFIFVTAFDSEQKKTEGLALGAKAFMVKNQFDTSSLINEINNIIHSI